MVSSSDTPIQNFKNTIINKINSLISTHDSNSSAHSTEMAKKLNVSQGTTHKGKFLKVNNSGNVACETVNIPSDVSDLNDSNDAIWGNLEAKYDGNGRYLEEVAFSGSYNDLTDQPNIPSAYSHPASKQCNYSYTHPTSKQCNASIPTGSSTATDIKMDGTQSAGSSSNFAKADHVHPTDTSRAASDHSHSGDWVSKTTTIGTLMVNEKLRLAQFTHSGSVNSQSANTEREIGSFSSTYAPPNIIYVLAHSSPGASPRYIIHANGKVGFIAATTTTYSAYCTVLWKY